MEDANTNAEGISDDALDQMINDFENMKRPERKRENVDIDELLNHPAFMQELDLTKPLSEEVEGLMAIKYEDEDPVAKATSYKEDGNYEFQKKKYRIAIDNYTVAIQVKCPDLLLNAVVYTNRAAAQFHLGNYRSAFRDCVFARKFKLDHMKAICRGANCCFEMKKYEECIKWADDAINIEPTDKKMMDLRNKASKLQKSLERDKRKENQRERKVLAEETKLIQAIQGQGIKLSGIKKMCDGDAEPTAVQLASLETENPYRAKVHLDSNNVLYWPVMFLYPEYAETDYIQMFCENHRLIDHINNMFGTEVEPPQWDKEKKYKPHTINVYFEDRKKEELIKVNKEKTLVKVLQHERYLVYGGTPSFFLTVAGSEFEKDFVDRYGKS